ncbi:hypothetical protein SAMN02745121_03529 [Nannocystis exedens]|uniref:Concanavalin A-like lectin/glucanases superfamily protein n=1 Tax=Nannocystis exedens TaxID=54 RepID=A0A1I1YXP4_9BACT|nr:hypothetical protein [Nannocystis exedens]PCC70150.1 hypothetical protein NAEX_03183 [Nannocystis exedens]SFE22810.1 hypothetical protein SAMN02745121_03529 [Nannocystis exedens]
MPRPPARRLAALAVLLAACSYDGSGLVSVGEPTSPSSTTTTTGEPAITTTTSPITTGGPALTTTGTTAPVDPTEVTTGDPTTDATTTTSSTSSTTEASTTTGDETTGPPPPMLVDDDLLVRYFLDEAGSGQGPTHALDAAPDPLDLPLVYDMGAMNPVYAEQGGHRGLRWPMAGLHGRATLPVADTKVQTGLQNRTAATLEVVVDIDAVTLFGSRLLHVGRSLEQGYFTLRSTDIDRLEFYWKGNTLAGVWPVDWAGLGRVVVHVVVDTGQPEPIHRVRLYLDGAAVVDGNDIGLVHPNQNEAIAIPTDPNIPLYFALGNRGADGDRSFQGTLHYAAIYATALSEPQLQQNAAILAGTDDAP